MNRLFVVVPCKVETWEEAKSLVFKNRYELCIFDEEELIENYYSDIDTVFEITTSLKKIDMIKTVKDEVIKKQKTSWTPG